MHARRSSWGRSEFLIFISHKSAGKGQIEIPKPLKDISGGTGKSIWIRIIFTKISNNKVLVVSMTATINREHKNLPPVDKIYSIGFIASFEWFVKCLWKNGRFLIKRNQEAFILLGWRFWEIMWYQWWDVVIWL